MNGKHRKAVLVPAVVLGRRLIQAAFKALDKRRDRQNAAHEPWTPPSPPEPEPEPAPPTPPEPSTPHVYTTGTQVLAEGSGLRNLTDTEDLDCCVFSSMWALAVAGKYQGASTTQARKLFPEWWRKANVWDVERLWSGPPAFVELLGGFVYAPVIPDVDGSPTYTEGRWHVVQEWGFYKDGRIKGHMYLVAAYKGGSLTRVESDRNLGYRASDFTVQHYPTGRTVLVATLNVEA
jgi:hypothetical protein